MIRPKVTIKPRLEPVQVKELKSALRITDSEEDTLLSQYIRDAREMAETYLGRKLINQTVTAYFSSFYEIEEPWWEGTRVVPVNFAYGNRSLDLAYLPVQSITQVDTVDDTNTETVYDSSNYYLDNYDEDQPSRMVLNEGATLPADIRVPNGIKVAYVCGYGPNPSDVPHHIRRGVTLLASYLWSNRGDCSDASSCIEASGAMSWLRMEKVIKL